MENHNLLDAILFFGLEVNFSRQEFHKAFHNLAMRYHPDRGEFTSDVLFVELIRYKVILEEYLEIRENRNHENAKKSKEYEIYKEAKRIENEAVLSYFKQRDGQQILLQEQENPELKVLKSRLTVAKNKYQTIILNHPESVWVEDSKDSIHRIDIWLR